MDDKYMQDRSRNAVSRSCTQMKQHETLPLITISRGEGACLYVSDGKRYLDAIRSWRANLFGHANKCINTALHHPLNLELRPLGNAVYFMPPYVINEQEMDLPVAGTLRALESC
jgi:adenosylmethionine-8-amino-7-oxononanoate aminotransferase